MKTVQQTITEGINDLTVEKDGKSGQQTKPSHTTPTKKSASAATSISKQKGLKQISIRGIPMVNFLAGFYLQKKHSEDEFDFS